MRSEVSSLACNDASLIQFFSGKRNSLSRRRFRRVAAPRAGGDVHRRGPEPPWFVVPPSPPPEIALPSSRPWPQSLRMEQMKQRLAMQPLPSPAGPPVVDDPAVNAVSSILSMIGDLQICVLTDEAVLERASRDRRDSFVWLFRRVFFSSPNLLVSLLVLLADLVVFSAEISSPDTAASESSQVLQEPVLFSPPAESVGFREVINWFDVGIKEGPLDPRQHEDEESCVDRRRRAYERAIAEGESSSLVLGNYAQFLYAVANDHDRAELYFQWAAMAAPRDAEAVSRYAFFLWEGRGDISGAEQMFLEAIEIEPGNHYFSSNYAWFLWKTGALDTCYPINPPSAQDW